ncbi:Adenosine deaminase [Candidatus Rhodobacter oscarellae]|uniref:Adenosine deaminase n=1 Tax=Candidatus Rhodobacter oscarellae TaxID=1675527 RepID=A0A0J9ED96_9RHOB|nr:adenosine deaminase [Candidatus Rhodobacter lobularis]KMW60680.1 Adenosine deaminase [Candidatus Rhodobacter lobularis]
MSVADLPKVELHLHLEGAMPPDFTRQLAHEKKMDLSGIFDAQGGYAYRDFWHFLQVYEAATTVLQGPEDFHRLALAVLEESAANGVVYTETFISANFCGGYDPAAWGEHIAAIQEAAAQAEAKHGITLRGVVTAVRHEGIEMSRQTAALAQEAAGDFITGFGIAGDEKVHHPRDFSYAFDMAREAGLRLTAHAGEWGGAASVRDALDHLRPERLGHGVEAIYDDALVDRLAEDEVVLEVCPGSNVFLGVFPSWEAHPIERLRARGVKVTVSTDDPPFFRTTMRREYEMLAETFGWDADQFRAMNQVALGAAFCDEDTRARVAKRLET